MTRASVRLSSALAIAIVAGFVPLVAAQTAPPSAAQGAPAAGAPQQPAPPQPMSFFVTSAGAADGSANLGGLAGADAICQARAAAVGAGTRTWRAYLERERVRQSARRQRPRSHRPRAVVQRARRARRAERRRSAPATRSNRRSLATT